MTEEWREHTELEDLLFSELNQLNTAIEALQSTIVSLRSEIADLSKSPSVSYKGVF